MVAMATGCTGSITMSCKWKYSGSAKWPPWIGLFGQTDPTGSFAMPCKKSGSSWPDAPPSGSTALPSSVKSSLCKSWKPYPPRSAHILIKRDERLPVARAEAQSVYRNSRATDYSRLKVIFETHKVQTALCFDLRRGIAIKCCALGRLNSRDNSVDIFMLHVYANGGSKMYLKMRPSFKLCAHQSVFYNARTIISN